MYGAPIWADGVTESPKIVKKARALQRKVSIRVIRAYRTVSQEMALMLARNPPAELLAGKLKAVHDRKKAILEENGGITEH